MSREKLIRRIIKYLSCILFGISAGIASFSVIKNLGETGIEILLLFFLESFLIYLLWDRTQKRFLEFLKNRNEMDLCDLELLTILFHTVEQHDKKIKELKKEESKDANLEENTGTW